jgi:hypothetical protein
MCIGFQCPICVSVQCDNGVNFRVVSCSGVSSGPTDEVGVTGSVMLQRRKYDHI